MSVKNLLKHEIDELSEDVALEIFDYLRFIMSKKERDSLVKSVQELSEKSLEKIWDNEEDSVYDSI